MRRFSVSVLIVLAVLPTIFFIFNLMTNRPSIFPLPQRLHQLFVFPVPIVFNDSVYLYEHEILLHSSVVSLCDPQWRYVSR